MATPRPAEEIRHHTCGNAYIAPHGQTYANKILKKLDARNLKQPEHEEILKRFLYCTESAYNVIKKLDELTFLNKEFVDLIFKNITYALDIECIYVNHPESFTRYDHIATLLKNPTYLGILLESFKLISAIPALNKSENYFAIIGCVEQKCDEQQLSYFHMNLHALEYTFVKKYWLLPGHKASLLTQENFDSLVKFADHSKEIWQERRKIKGLTQDKFTKIIAAFHESPTSANTTKKDKTFSFFCPKAKRGSDSESKSDSGLDNYRNISKSS